MKRYLFRGATALVLGGFIAACSHDDIDYSSIVDGKLKAYQEVFVDAYGKINPNQTWGLGTVSVQESTAMARQTRAIQPLFIFPSDADSNKFLADVPNGVEKLTQNVARANNWIDETWEGDLNIWGGATAEGNYQDRSGGTLYIKGNCDFSNRSFYFDGHSELYLLEGATLTLNADNAANLQTYTNIYMAPNSKIVTTAELKLNNGLHIFNHGTIEAGKLSTNSDSWLVNAGTVKITNKISVDNTLSVIVNNGTITAADLNTAGSGKFENNHNVTISGTTFVNSNDNTWVNNGHYHTGNFIYNAASDEVINNCFLEVDEDFNINLGDNPGNGNFKMDAGSGVVTKYFNGGGNWAKNYSTGWSTFNGGPFYIYMGAASVFRVTETATMNATKADYGIYGPPTGPYAVFEAKEIVAGADNQGYEVTYGNNLYVSAESHFPNGMSGQYPFIDFKGNAKIFAPGFEDGEIAVKIDETACNPGFNGGFLPDETTIPIDQSETSDDRSVVETIVEYYETTELIEQGRVFCEDLGQISTNDLDFNDVVFDAYVYKVTPMTRTVVRVDGVLESDDEIEGEPTYKTTIILLAAGGTLPLSIADSYQVHNVMGSVPVSTIVNTIVDDNGAYHNSWSTHDPVVLGTEFTYRTIEEIPIQVQYGNGETLKLEAITGWAPHKILVPIGTKWCKERVDIATAYTTFKDYVGGEDGFWTNGIEESLLYTHPMDTYRPRSMEPSKKLIGADEPVITYRPKGTTIVTGGYQNEEVLSRKNTWFNE